jgi:hypothetical protein
MGLAKGYTNIAAVKKQTAFDTPVACGAGDGIEYTNESLSANVQFIEDQEINGRAVTLAGDAGNEQYAGQLTADCKFQGLDLLIATALGTAGAPVQQGATSAYKHTWLLADNVEDLFVTTAIKKIPDTTPANGSVFEYVGCKVGGVQLACAPGERAKVTFPMLAHDMNENAASGTNNMTTIDTVTLPSVREFLKFGQMEVFINAQAGADFVAGDEVYVNNFSLNIERPFEPDYTTRYGTKIENPATNGFVGLTGSISFPTYATENKPWFAAQLTKAQYKMKVLFTGPVADTGYNYEFAIWLPTVQFSEGTPNTGGPGKLPLELDFVASRSLADPTGFPTNSGASGLAIEAVNLNAVDPLA